MDIPELFMANLAALSAAKNLGRLPGTTLVFTNRFGSELFERNKASRMKVCAKARLGILTSRSEKVFFSGRRKRS
jgi:hypothetical protein